MSITRRASITSAAERARAALGELLELVADSAPAEVIEALGAVESVGRLADAVRVRVATPLAENATLAEQFGFRSAADAVADVAQISRRAARTRVAVAAAVGTSRSLTGVELPPQRPALAEALDAGEVGLEAASLIVRELDAVASHTESDVQAAAEQLMVTLASGIDPTTGAAASPVSVDYLTAEVRQIASAVDPDGARPREERALRSRGLRVGAADVDGLRSVNGRLLADTAALLEGLLEAQRRTPKFVDVASAPAGGDIDELTDVTGLPIDPATSDDRTPDQRRHDAFAEILIAATQAEGAPQLNGAPVTVLVTVNADDLGDDGYGGTDGEQGDGLGGDPIGTMAGTDVPVSRAEVLRYMDAAGYRTVTLQKGRIASISSQQRCFTSAQRLAIAARDGLRCATPGCTAPHYVLQVHHVIPDRDGGPTHTNNGILLCYWHHRLVDKGPWRYRMVNGVPQAWKPGLPDWVPVSAAQRLAA
ncbi:5-methylcytosine-specific restriction protein A [Leifsonia sp. AK011]|uniref:HNH endonuclease signature motif containing protein n=1 Tax=Leifsonia sp. AK011 TaxID=2723075 RepID=UPI0015C8693C|nr:HNH endonuclease signature motif containing protein [Leifsonia sp. AK011]NYF11658.1 5-methylcytosine-specific restriction protein A [Leifsonia sp. AK011]